MFNVTFYIFNKKENSTKQPDANVTKQEYSCILKEPSGILNPTISINMGLSLNPSQYNYCYIPTFNRYYYINEWSFEKGLWYASLSVDVLASCKNYIGNHDLYILRASAESDTYITDAKYPITNVVNSYIDNLGAVTVYRGDQSRARPNYFNTELRSGYYYLGVNGANGTGVTWYCMSASSFNTLINNLFSYIPTDMSDISTGVAKNIADPIQYIVDCYWLPDVPIGIIFDDINIVFGTYTIAVNQAGVFDPVASIQRYEATFNIRKHPQASNRGKYLNNAPFSNYQLFMQPFGTISLDASVMIDDTTLKAIWYVDYTTGEADLTIRATNSLLANLKAKLGVPIQLSQTTVSLLGQATGVLSSVLGGTTGTILGSVAESVFDMAGIEGAKSQPKPSSMGGGGNFLPFNSYRPTLNSDFYYIVDEYNNEIGRPLCKVRKPKNLGGYMVVLDGSIPAPFTKSELQEVNTYLTGGFYYE